MTTPDRRAVCLAVLLGAGAAAAPCPAQDQAVALAVHPAAVTLDSARATTRIVFVRTDAAGITLDVGDRVELEWSEDGIAEIGADGRLRGVRDGTAHLVARLGDAETQCVVTVRNAAEQSPVSFRNDVIPVLTRSGCNAGACHGSANGKNGFRLTLFGYDPSRDHRVLTREYRGRRTDLAAPDESLMLLKPTRAVQHKGGHRLEADSPHYRTVHDWIAEGALDDATDAPDVVRLVVEPRELVLAGRDTRLPIVVTAHYDDGATRDVTDLAILSTSSDATAVVDDTGIVTAQDRGEAFVLARFDHLAEIAQVIVLPDDRPPEPIGIEPFNEIDEFVHHKLRKLRLRPAGVCDDRTFVRRVYLDVIGRLPSRDDMERFLADQRADRRARLVDALIERPEFADVWASQWAEVLRIDSQTLKPKGVQVYSSWLRRAFAERLPLDEIVRRLLTGSGSNFENPTANYYVAALDPRVLAESTAQVFLGIRLQCAQCHNHPFERWTMEDYYGFAAFFGQVGRKGGEDPRERVVFDAGSGGVRNPKNNVVAPPRFLGGAEPAIEPGTDRRAVLAAWLASAENPWFAQNVANRVWARFFGRGVVDPPDDRRVSNPPSHPRLFERLGRLLVESRFDVRALVRLICTSRTYQLAAHLDAPPAATYAGAPLRRLSAEQLLDAIGQVTGVATRFRGLPPGASAVQVMDSDPRNRFLDLFGRPRHQSVCTCERRDDPTLNQVLHLINGETIEQKIRAADGWLARDLAAEKPPEAMLEELFLRAYCRPPSESEAEQVLAAVTDAEDAAAAWQDVYWAVLNSKEFLFQH